MNISTIGNRPQQQNSCKTNEFRLKRRNIRRILWLIRLIKKLGYLIKSKERKQLQDDRAALRQSEQLTENKAAQIEIELEFLRGLEIQNRIHLWEVNHESDT